MRRCLVLLLITGTVWAQKLVLNDGKIIIENLSPEEIAIFDAKKDAKKWLFFPPTAVLTVAASSGSYFIITGHHPLESTIALIIPVFGLFGSYSFFREIDEKIAENMRTDEYISYQLTYSDTYRKLKYKNIQKSCLALGIAGALGTYIFFKNFSLGPNAFGPSSNAGFK